MAQRRRSTRPAMALVEVFVPGCVAPVDGPAVIEDGLLVVLDSAALDQAARSFVLGVHRIDGDDTPGEVEAA